MLTITDRECYWCRCRIGVEWQNRLKANLCTVCADIYQCESKRQYWKDYWDSEKRPCSLCPSRDGVRKWRDQEVWLCRTHRKKKNDEIKKKEGPTPEERKEGCKRILCAYIEEIRRFEADLAPICVECGGSEDVVAVKTGKGMKLLCLSCRDKLYHPVANKKRVAVDKRRCDRCRAVGARKVMGEDLYLCPQHTVDHRIQKRQTAESAEKSKAPP